MSWRLILALIVVPSFFLLDVYLVRSMMRAWRRARRRAHLHIIAGTICSYCVGVFGAGIVVFEADPANTTPFVWNTIRVGLTLSATLGYAFVAFFTADAFHPHTPSYHGRARLYAVFMLALAVTGLLLEPNDVPAPPLWRWSLRIPYAIGALLAFAVVASECLRAHAAFAEAKGLGRDVDPVVLHRMRVLGQGSAIAAVSHVFLFVPRVHARMDDSLLGWSAIVAILLGVLAFVLATFATWATPDWLRARWESDGEHAEGGS